MKFTKMHGIGNDYVYVDCFREKVPNPAETARFVSDRHFGIGSDGLILIKPSEIADCEMDMYNLDGSRGKMCGNGIRCVAKYAFDHGLVHSTRISVATASGIKYLSLSLLDGKVSAVRVNMGEPHLLAGQIPVKTGGEGGFALAEGDRVIHEPLLVDGSEYFITAVSMGNPHAVIFTEDVAALDLPRIGPKFENHPAFPERVNTEFIQLLEDGSLRMRVWERGSGETLACGTGACAAAVAACLNEKADRSRSIQVRLLGGNLVIKWSEQDNCVYMTGSATEVFSGEIELPPSCLDDPKEE